MSIEFMVLDRGALVYARAVGTLTDEDLAAYEQKLLHNTQIRRGFKLLLDGRWVADDQTTEAGLTRLTAAPGPVSEKLRGARYAIVTHSSRWFNAGARHARNEGGVPLIVFNDPSTACIWLGVDYTALMQGMLFRFPPIVADAPAYLVSAPAPAD